LVTGLLKSLSIVALFVLVSGLAGCSGLGALASKAGNGSGTLGHSLGAQSYARTSGPGVDVIETGEIGGDRRAIIETGAGSGAANVTVSKDPALEGKQVTLNFVDTDIREFARVLFSEVLQVPYLIDPNIAGTVTVRSGGRIEANRALVLAKQALETVGSTIRVSDGVYRVTGLASGGYDAANVRSFELNFIDANAAQGALQGLIQGRAEIISSSGNAITMRGDTETLSLVASMISAIDVDRFRTASFGLFPLRYGAATEVADELRSLYLGVGASNQTIIPIDRINAVLVIASKAENLQFAQKWLDRLDQGPQNQRLVHVYQVKNREADELAKLLDGIFKETMPVETTVVADAAEGQSLTAPGAFLGPATTGGSDGIKVTADPGANKLVIWATKKEYSLIDQALRRLDTPLSQVYVETTIAEVRLGGELRHGVRWFLEAGGLSAGYSDASNGAVAPSFPGFNFAFQVPQAELVISALESHTNVRIVSTPQLTVVDRETATIQVGDQVPIITKSVQDASSGRPVIANDVTFRDTGVILKVTPQIRSSGEVLLDIAQEVSRVVPTTSSQIDSPTISQRKVESTVLVPDGTAIVLAGLMSSNGEESQGGLPGTKGTLLESIFGSKKEAVSRTELIIIIRPMIIRDRSDLRDVAAEVADKMQDVMRVPVE
jgi:general secretion pathway protein D